MTTVHKESGTKLQNRCWWNSPKAHVQFFVPRDHCPEVNSKAKDMENCRYTTQRIWKLLKNFPHNYLCESVQFFRSSRKDVWRVWIPTRENGETRSDEAVKFLIRAQCDQNRISFGFWWPCESRSYIAAKWRTNWKLSQQDKLNKFCMDTGFSSVVKVGQYFMSKDNGKIVQWLDVNGLYQAIMNHHNEEDGSRETQKLDPYWKSRSIICTTYMELNSESGLWVETIVTPGFQFLLDQINWWWIRKTMTEVLEDQSEEQALQLNVKDLAYQ